MPPLPSLRQLATGLVHLFYPNLCAGCQRNMPATTEQCFCVQCQAKLTYFQGIEQRENAFTERFWGRLTLEGGGALYEFYKRSPVHRALWQLKYKKQPEVGVRLGRALGHRLKTAVWFQDVQVIIPIPLHPNKERERGYNQSAQIAQGLGEVTGVRVAKRALKRTHATESQTQKKRLERFQNVREVFSVAKPNELAHQHVLLVDDVLTTGATLEACAIQLLSVPGLRLSMATLAIRMQE